MNLLIIRAMQAFRETGKPAQVGGSAGGVGIKVGNMDVSVAARYRSGNIADTLFLKRLSLPGGALRSANTPAKREGEAKLEENE